MDFQVHVCSVLNHFLVTDYNNINVWFLSSQQEDWQYAYHHCWDESRMRNPDFSHIGEHPKNELPGQQFNM